MSCLKNTDIMNVDVMSEKHWCHKCRFHVIFTDFINGTYMTSVFQIWHLHYDISLFHLTSTFMPSLFFGHDISILRQFFQTCHLHYDISVFCHHFVYNCKNVTVLVWNEFVVFNICRWNGFHLISCLKNTAVKNVENFKRMHSILKIIFKSHQNLV
jgi:hypothetical protein